MHYGNEQGSSQAGFPHIPRLQGSRLALISDYLHFPTPQPQSGGHLGILHRPVCPSGPLRVSPVSGSLLLGDHGPRWESAGLWLASCSGSLSRPSWQWTGSSLSRPPGDREMMGLFFFSGNVRLLIIQMFIGQNTEHRHSLPLFVTY